MNGLIHMTPLFLTSFLINDRHGNLTGHCEGIVYLLFTVAAIIAGKFGFTVAPQPSGRQWIESITIYSDEPEGQNIDIRWATNPWPLASGFSKTTDRPVIFHEKHRRRNADGYLILD